MKTIKEHILCKEENGDCLVAEIVEDVTEEEADEFEEVELIEDDTPNEDEQKKLSDLVKKYVKSYCANRDKMDIREWLTMMFVQDFPDMSQEKIQSMSDEIIKEMEKRNHHLDKIRKRRAIGLSSIDYVASEISESEEFKKIPNKKEVLKKIDDKLTDIEIEHIYKTADLDSESDSISSSFPGTVEIAGKAVGQQEISRYFYGIKSTISKANIEMGSAIHTNVGNINMNPNLDGFIAEQYHAGSFNIDAATKDLKGVMAEALTPDGKVYGKNSVDIVIKEIRDGSPRIVKKYQAKFGKDPVVTQSYFNDASGKYKYKFQRKLVPENQSYKIANSTGNIEYKGARSKGINKDEVKNLQNRVQKGDEKAANFTFKKDVDTITTLKSIGAKSINIGIMAGVGAAGVAIASKLIQGEDIEPEEIVAEAIKTGGNVGVATAVAGALTTAAEKGITSGILANNGVISTIAFSTVNCLSALFKIGTGEYSFKEGMGEIATILTAAYVSTKAYILGSLALGTVAGMIAAPAAAVTVAAVVGGTLLAMAGGAVVNAVGSGIKAVTNGIIEGAGALVKGGVAFVSAAVNAGVAVAGFACSVVESVVSTAGSMVGSVVSGVCDFVGGLFGGWW